MHHAECHSISSLHIHEQPLIARELGAVGEIVQGRQAESDPAQILNHGIARSRVGVAVDADDEAIAGEGVDFAKFEKGHEPTHVSFHVRENVTTT
jgi:hypothetical protein